MVRLNVSGDSPAGAEYRSQNDNGAVTPGELSKQGVGMQTSEE
jgi:hypothetical protein